MRGPTVYDFLWAGFLLSVGCLVIYLSYRLYRAEPFKSISGSLLIQFLAIALGVAGGLVLAISLFYGGCLCVMSG